MFYVMYRCVVVFDRGWVIFFQYVGCDKLFVVLCFIFVLDNFVMFVVSGGIVYFLLLVLLWIGCYVDIVLVIVWYD